MKVANPLRLIFVSVFCLILAVVLAIQTASIALTSEAPENAARLFPLNGLAQENVASAIFSSSVALSGEPQSAAQLGEGWARTSYRYEPLTPESHAILALAQQDSQARSILIGLAAQLNRREPTLQALVLQEHVASENYAGAVETLDGILRVRPSRSSELFPVLLSVFAQYGAVEEFAEVLDGTSQWHQQFLNYAVKQPTALANLVQLRKQADFNEQKFDQSLLRNLAQQNELQSGYDLYTQFAQSGRRSLEDGILSWESTYAPFDWHLKATADFRAQPSLNSADLELYVRPGSGGVFATRIIKSPQAPFSIVAEHQITPRDLSEDVQISLRCTQNPEPFSQGEFSGDGLNLSIENLPASCLFMEIALQARAWSGQAALKGTISPLKIGL
ncbi:hypothetical protein [Qipengyuania huizhouensis]|uniref:hypothetical protein n=1 Tax=Qipengyuania huizhouensis TaxID=2867245 RepID=UPI001C86C0C4|nr:hypothetical protein [Qipengyuania huizhouensis]MBX7460395.1 hypothetical protein [Qipengyuania huizhouensis]